MDEIIHEFLQALTEEITALRQGGPGASVKICNGRFVRREGGFYVYAFTTKNPLVVMDDAPTRVMIHGKEFSGQIISVQGSEWVVGIEHASGETIAEASLILELWFLLERVGKLMIVPGVSNFWRLLGGSRRNWGCDTLMT